jgi:hypothetical protein
VVDGANDGDNMDKIRNAKSWRMFRCQVLTHAAATDRVVHLQIEDNDG